MLKEFKDFLLRGNVIDLAVGVVMGTAFQKVVSSIVANLLTPLIAAVAKVPDFSALEFTLNGSKFSYGLLVNEIISFILVGAAIFFFVVKPVNMLTNLTKKEAAAAPTTKKCPECLGEIPIAAKRCMHCGQPIHE
jgi:large conductance mechanosensitive channel